jgi:hypothetical protein
MGLSRDVRFEIVGQVRDDIGDKDYEILKAKLQLICSEYGLDLEEKY